VQFQVRPAGGTALPYRRGVHVDLEAPVDRGQVVRRQRVLLELGNHALAALLPDLRKHLGLTRPPEPPKCSRRKASVPQPAGQRIWGGEPHLVLRDVGLQELVLEPLRLHAKVGSLLEREGARDQRELELVWCQTQSLQQLSLLVFVERRLILAV